MPDKLNQTSPLSLDLIFHRDAAGNAAVNKASLVLTTLWEASWCNRSPCCIGLQVSSYFSVFSDSSSWDAHIRQLIQIHKMKSSFFVFHTDDSFPVSVGVVYSRFLHKYNNVLYFVHVLHVSLLSQYTLWSQLCLFFYLCQRKRACDSLCLFACLVVHLWAK